MEKYEAIEMEVIAFDTDDVIVTSIPHNAGDTNPIDIPYTTGE